MLSERRAPLVIRTSGVSGPPSVMSISPLRRPVTVGYQRSNAMSAPRVQLFVTGLKTCVWRIPLSWAFLLPPAMKTEPSSRCARPLQKMLKPVLTRTSVCVPVCGSQTVARVVLWTG